VSEAGACIFEDARSQLAQELPDIPSPTMVLERAVSMARAKGMREA